MCALSGRAPKRYNCTMIGKPSKKPEKVRMSPCFQLYICSLFYDPRFVFNCNTSESWKLFCPHVVSATVVIAIFVLYNY